jgi:hypothetical protein
MPSGREFRYGKACGERIHMVVAQHDIRNRKRTNFVQACGDMGRTVAAHGRLVEHF